MINCTVCRRCYTLVSNCLLNLDAPPSADLSVAARCCGKLWLAVTPDPDAVRPGLWPAVPGLGLIPQGRGDLGTRMARPLMTLPRGPVIIVGTDIPDISRGHIADGFAALGHVCKEGRFFSLSSEPLVLRVAIIMSNRK